MYFGVLAVLHMLFAIFEIFNTNTVYFTLKGKFLFYFMSEFVISRFDAALENLNIQEQYSIGPVKIYITSDGKYLVQEPKLSFAAEQTWQSMMTDIHKSFPYNKIHKDQIIPQLKNALEEQSRSTDNFQIWKKEKESIEYYLTRDLVNYSEIDILMKDKHIEDILAVRWDKPLSIVHNKYPKFTLLETNVVFESEYLMSKLIHRISQRFGNPPDELNPITSFTNQHNVRFTFTDFKKITPDGPTLSIRKPSIDTITIYHLLKSDILHALAASYLWMMMDLKGFGLIIGAPSAGKTTLINALLTMSNPRWHYFTIEDALELKLLHANVSRHQTQINSSLQNIHSKNAFDVFDLCKLSLRFRPDFVVVGEVLGKETEGLFQVASSGSGCLSSFHASNALNALSRLEHPPINISKTQTSMISHITHMSWVRRQNTQVRKILSITEIHSNDDTQSLCEIFKYDEQTGKLTPDDVESIVQKSQKIQLAKTVLGIDDIADDLRKRACILQKILEQKISDPLLISKEIFTYYE